MKIEVYAKPAPALLKVTITIAEDIALRAILSPQTVAYYNRDGKSVTIKCPIRKVDAIKFLRISHNIGLYEAKMIIDELTLNHYTKPRLDDGTYHTQTIKVLLD